MPISFCSSSACRRVRAVSGEQPISEYLCVTSCITGSGTGRPLVTLRRYSGISSARSGVPWASSRTAVWAFIADLYSHSASCSTEGVHLFDQGLHVLNGCFGQYAMAEIKNMSWPAVGLQQDCLCPLPHQPLISKEQHRIHVSLCSATMTKQLPSLIQRDAPIQTDHIGSRL